MIRQPHIVSALEALYAGEPLDAWGASVVARMRALVERSAQVSFVLYDQPASRVLCMAFADEGTAGPYRAALGAALDDMSPEKFVAQYRGGPPLWVLSATDREYHRRLVGAASGADVDVIGLIAEPEPFVAGAVSFMVSGSAPLDRRERAALTLVALHVEAAARLRLRPDAVVGYVTPLGRVEVTAATRAEAARVADAARAVDRSRTRARRDDGAEALDVWRALVAGRYALAERVEGDGKRVYAVYENAPRHAPLRALTPRESFVVHECARGLSNKEVAYALGISQTVVSTALTRAAHKLGVTDAASLVRIAAGFGRSAQGPAALAGLTAAELAVADGVLRGLTNAQIARERGVSLRTVANQVAAVLRKTGARSRRAVGASGRPEAQGAAAP